MMRFPRSPIYLAATAFCVVLLAAGAPLASPPVLTLGPCAGPPPAAEDATGGAVKRFVEHLLSDMEGQFGIKPRDAAGKRVAELCDILIQLSDRDDLIIPRLKFQVSRVGDNITLTPDTATPYEWKIVRLGSSKVVRRGTVSFRLTRRGGKAPSIVINETGDLRNLDIALGDVQLLADGRKVTIGALTLAAAMRRRLDSTFDMGFSDIRFDDGTASSTDIAEAEFRVTMQQLADWKHLMALIGPFPIDDALGSIEARPIADAIAIEFNMSGAANAGGASGGLDVPARFGTVTGAFGISGLMQPGAVGALKASIDIADGEVSAFGGVPASALPTRVGIAVELSRLDSRQLWRTIMAMKVGGPAAVETAGEAMKRSMIATGARLAMPRFIVAMAEASVSATGRYRFVEEAEHPVGETTLRITGLDALMKSLEPDGGEPALQSLMLRGLADIAEVEIKGGVKTWRYDLRVTADGRMSINGKDAKELFNPGKGGGAMPKP